MDIYIVKDVHKLHKGNLLQKAGGLQGGAKIGSLGGVLTWSTDVYCGWFYFISWFKIIPRHILQKQSYQPFV